MSTPEPDPEAWCSVASAWSDEPMPGSAPRADVWVVVEQPGGWEDAPLARSDAGVRVVMARAPRGRGSAPRVWVARCSGPAPTLRRAPIADVAEVAGWDLHAVAEGALDDQGEAVTEPLLLVCTNGRRDRCCGHVGGRLARDLAAAGLGPMLTCTHLGGHRFAPTALLLPWGALLGRLDLDSTRHLLAEARAGRAVASSLRGYSTLSAPAQVAEVYARERTGHDGLQALDVRVDLDPTDDHARAEVVLPSGATVTVQLRRELAGVLPSCGKHLESTPRWVVA